MTKTILVPVEPSEEMLRAGVRAFQKAYTSTDTLADWRACFKATCAAAPKPILADDREEVARRMYTASIADIPKAASWDDTEQWVRDYWLRYVHAEFDAGRMVFVSPTPQSDVEGK